MLTLNLSILTPIQHSEAFQLALRENRPLSTLYFHFPGTRTVNAARIPR